MLLSWLMYFAGLGMLGVWIVVAMTGKSPREALSEALHEFVRMGIMVETLVPAVWYSLVGVAEIAVGCWLLSFSGGSWGLLFALAGWFFLVIGLWTGVLFGLKRGLGLVTLSAPKSPPLYGSADLSPNEELKRGRHIQW